MSLAVDGFWKAGFWSQTFWATGFWFEGGSVVPVVPVPAIGPLDYPISYMQPQRNKRKKDHEIWLLLLG